jgi:hypothetical protein
MGSDPWTDPDPQPGDFDREVAAVDPRDVQIVEPGSGAAVTIVVSVEGEDAQRLQRLASERGQKPGEVVAGLLRAS